MKPVDQTNFSTRHGNCFAACLASILELTIEDVPNFMANEEFWLEDAHKWCASLGYTLLLIKDDAVKCGYVDTRPLFSHFLIVTGSSPRGNFLHCVVQHRGTTIHDPHPSRAGLVGKWVDFIVLIPNVLV